MSFDDGLVVPRSEPKTHPVKNLKNLETKPFFKLLKAYHTLNKISLGSKIRFN